MFERSFVSHCCSVYGSEFEFQDISSKKIHIINHMGWMPSFLMRPTAQWSFSVSSSIDFVAPGVFSKTTAGLTKRSGLVQAPSNGGSGCWSSKQEGKHGWMISTNFPFPTEIHILDAFQGRHGFVCEICFLFSWINFEWQWIVFCWIFSLCGSILRYAASSCLHEKSPLPKGKELQCGPQVPKKINTFNSRPFFAFVGFYQYQCWWSSCEVPNTKMIVYHPDLPTYPSHDPIQKMGDPPAHARIASV